jgi:hypothetical protein
VLVLMLVSWMLALQSNVRSALPNKTCFSIASFAV